LTTPEKIGILGGTFDPPHWAHLRVAAHFARLFQLDRLLLIPSGNPWQKSAFITPPETRYQLTQAAAIALNRLLGDEGIQIPIEVDRIELDRQGPSYTIDTAIALRQRYGSTTHLIWLMGADSLMQIDTWQDWQYLLKEVHLAVARRPEFALTIDPQSELGRFIQTHQTTDPKQMDRLPCGLIYLDQKMDMYLSSIAIRKQLAVGGINPNTPLTEQIPDEVLNLIEKLGLYSQSR
jgi:nicotinate-nucleotide adenylyltransferase